MTSPDLNCVTRHLFRAATLLAVSCAARAQCPGDWSPGEGHPGVTGDGPVSALTTWDPDGAGPLREVLVAAGGFDGAGNEAALGIATWDGENWHPLNGGAAGVTGSISALAVYNGDLIIGGNITAAGGVPVNMIARFDGEAWHPLGSGVGPYPVWTLAVYNGELYAGGLFNTAGGVPVNGVARWNGSTWQNVGGGLSPGAGVRAMTVFDDTLIVGGGFTSAGGVPATRFASWDGSSWQSMDGGTIHVSNVDSFGTYNKQLIAGANFFTPGGVFLRSLSRWNGTAWEALGPGNPTPNDAVFALQEFQGQLYAGGIFTSAGGISTPFRMARWNGNNWSSIPAGAGMPSRSCRSFTIYNDDLIAGGTTSAPSGLPASEVGSFDGTAWHLMGAGIDAVVYDIASYNGEVILGGWFSMTGNGASNGIVRRDSKGQWRSLGTATGAGISGGDQYVFHMVVYDERLIVSGSFTAIDGVPAPNGIAQWDGSAWQPFGSTPIFRKIVHAGQMYGVGNFGPHRHVARWDPIAQVWQPIGAFPENAGITSIAFFQDDLVAGGIGGIGVNASVWRWDFDNPRAGWQPVGQHLGYNLIQAIAEYDGELFVGGYDMGLLRFNGTSWTTFAGGLFLGNDAPDEVLAVFDLRVYQGDLIVAGTFSFAGGQQYSSEGVPVAHLARWNGANWSAFGDGTDNATVTLHEHQGTLFTGGWFQMAGGAPAGHWASWGPTCPVGDVNHDGAVNVDDLIAVILAWGACPAEPVTCPADIAPPDGNGQVDVDDLISVILNWS